MKKVILRPGKEHPIKNFNHWIFSGSIQKMPQDLQPGEIAGVLSNNNQFLGYGYFNPENSLAGRMLNFTQQDPIKSLEKNINKAITLREKLFDKGFTNAYRLINSEGDSIPGLTVDFYNNVLVFQVATLGIEKIKDQIVEIFVKRLNPKTIYEKSKMPSRKLENLTDFQGYLYGETNPIVEIIENGHKFEINLENSHKTGFYIDQREMRNLVGEISKNKKVLNCFSYTGGFSVYAAKNSAKQVTSIDISKEVIEQAKRNFALNNINIDQHKFIAEDVLNFVNENDFDYDIVILDPPAFAKKKSDIKNAYKAYKRMNKEVIKKIKPESFLLTCSCSYHMTNELFDSMIFDAVSETKRSVRILQQHRHAMDHPINVYNAEIDYLKCKLLYIE